MERREYEGVVEWTMDDPDVLTLRYGTERMARYRIEDCIRMDMRGMEGKRVRVTIEEVDDEAEVAEARAEDDGTHRPGWPLHPRLRRAIAKIEDPLHGIGRWTDLTPQAVDKTLYEVQRATEQARFVAAELIQEAGGA